VNKAENHRAASSELALAQSLDFQSSGSFQSEIGKLLADIKVRNVVLDCRHLVYIDGAGLGAIASAYMQAVRQGKTLELRNCALRLQKILRIGYLGQLISCPCSRRNVWVP